MKRTIKYLSILILLLSACSKDIGNYDYEEVNDIEIIDGVLQGVYDRDRVYRVVYADELKIAPVVKGSLSGDDVSQLQFIWTIDGEVVSEEQNLIYKGDKKYGQLAGILKIIDKKTSISKTYTFFLNVMNAYTMGYYILSQRANQDAVLYALAGEKDEMKIAEVTMPMIKDLGKNPIYMAGVMDRDYTGFDVYNRLYLGVKDAEYPVVVIDSREFLPFRRYHANSFVGGGGFELAPSQIWADLNAYHEFIYMINKGKLHVLTKGIISEVKYPDDPLGYQVASNGLFRPSKDLSFFGYNDQFVAFYDEKNKTIRLLSNQNNISFGFNVSHDDAIDASLLTGHEFLYGSNYVDGLDIVFTFLTRKNNRLFCFEVQINAITRIVTDLREIGSVAVPADEKIGEISFDESEGNYFLAIDQTIYSMGNSVLGNELELDEYLTLPATATGKITYFDRIGSPLGNPNTLMITTFDKDFPTAKKSSIYIYNIIDKSLFYVGENVVEEVKGIHVGV